jgi:hypothetical protein
MLAISIGDSTVINHTWRDSRRHHGAGSLGRGLGSSIPLLDALPLHRNAGRITDLDPYRTRTGSIGAVGALRDDAFSTKPAGMLPGVSLGCLDMGTWIAPEAPALWPDRKGKSRDPRKARQPDSPTHDANAGRGGAFPRQKDGPATTLANLRVNLRAPACRRP